MKIEMIAQGRVVKRFLVASAIALALPIAAHADPDMNGPDHHGGPMRHGGPGMGHGHDGMPPFLHELNLTEAQRDKIFEIHHALEPQMRNQAKIARKAQTELHAMILSDKYDEAKAKALADSSARAHAEMDLQRARSAHQVYELLTPEQRKQAAELKQRVESRRGAEGGPHGPRGPGAPRTE